jgi:hypothetical protein
MQIRKNTSNMDSLKLLVIFIISAAAVTGSPLDSSPGKFTDFTTEYILYWQ